MGQCCGRCLGADDRKQRADDRFVAFVAPNQEDLMWSVMQRNVILQRNAWLERCRADEESRVAEALHISLEGRRREVATSVARCREEAAAAFHLTGNTALHLASL